MTITREPEIYCNNCKQSGSVAESMTSKELQSNIKNIIDKYKEHHYQRGYCEMIHLSDLGDFHYCLHCIRMMKPD